MAHLIASLRFRSRLRHFLTYCRWFGIHLIHAFFLLQRGRPVRNPVGGLDAIPKRCELSLRSMNAGAATEDRVEFSRKQQPRWPGRRFAGLLPPSGLGDP